MVAVLDQFEIESLGSYQSGSYDQVIMGNMYSIKNVDGRKTIVLGNRGVVYGYADNEVQPGTTLFDKSISVSYKSQPFSEKSGASRSEKITCREERIYDSMPPHAWQCFKLNGAEVFICDDYNEAPGYPLPPGGPGTYTDPGPPPVEYDYSGLEVPAVGYIMFDNYVQNGSSSRKRLNVGVDRYWTKTFPYEPRYANITRQESLNFLKKDVYATRKLDFLSNGLLNAFPISPRRVNGAYIGTVGPEQIGQYFNFHGSEISEGSNWKHYWACDVFQTGRIENPTEISPYTIPDITSSMSEVDMAKVIYGFGDVNTKFMTSSYGQDILGTHNWPEFRNKLRTFPSPPTPPPESYEYLSASMWCVSPVIRGWKYGLHSGLPSYSSVHFRRGRYGQFRDMLEQRSFTKFFKYPNKRNKSPGLIIENKSISEGPVTVKFVDAKGNKTNPENTQSQNLSFEATSSLPYFDGQQRNRSLDSFSTTNLEMIIFGQTPTGEVNI